MAAASCEKYRGRARPPPRTADNHVCTGVQLNAPVFLDWHYIYHADGPKYVACGSYETDVSADVYEYMTQYMIHVGAHK